MALIALDAPPPELEAAAELEPAWRWVGWEEDGELVACAALSRDPDETVRVRALWGAATSDSRGVLLSALVDAVNAQELAADAGGDDWLYEACGFIPEPPGHPTHWRRPLEAQADPTAQPTVTLVELQAAIEGSWSEATSADPGSWTPANPAVGQCDVTALALRDILGGEILIANVVKEGRRLERHAWNRLPSGVEVDLTRSQYRNGEALARPTASQPLGLNGLERRYDRFARRLRGALGRGSDARVG